MSKFVISNLQLRSIVESTVSDAIKGSDMDAEAERQQRIQKGVEKKLAASSKQSDDRPGIKREEDDPTNTGAPHRSAGTDPTAKGASPGAPAGTPQKEVIDADAVIDKFNIIRSGRSLNDRDIKDLMKKYLGSLAPQQMQGVYMILQRIASIVAPTVDATRAHAPPEEPSSVTNARLQMLQKKAGQAPEQQPNPQSPGSEQKKTPDEVPPEEATPKRPKPPVRVKGAPPRV